MIPENFQRYVSRFDTIQTEEHTEGVAIPPRLFTVISYGVLRILALQ